MKTHSIPALLAILSSALSTTAVAGVDCDKSYAFRVDVSRSAGSTFCDSSAKTFIDALANFNASNAGYTNVSQATASGRFSDVNVTLDYAANSTTLNYNFAEIGEVGSFTGTTRQQSQDLLKDYIKKNGLIGKLMKYQAQHSASSPISGAGGLIPTAISSDFNQGFNNSPTAAAAPSASGGASNNLIGVGINYSAYDIDSSGDKIRTTTLPFSYTIRNDLDPRRQLAFSMPITLTETGNAKTVHAGLGISYRVPMTDNWSLTPAGRYSMVASEDRATVASLYSGSLSSIYVIGGNGFDVAIGNMVGLYRTGKFASGDYSFDPDIKNIAFRNGVMLSHPANFGRKMTIEYSLIDTRYTGDKPYLDKYQELSVTLGTNKSAYDSRSFVRGGLTLMRGPGTKAIAINLGYWF